MLFQNIEQNFLCYTVGPCWLSIIVTWYCVCTFNMKAQRINICGWSTGIFYLRGQVGLKFHPWGWLTKSSELEGNTGVNQMKHIDRGAQAVKDAEAVTFPCVCVWVTQSCLTLCDPMDCSPPGSSVHGILQARIMEWATISFPSGPSQPRDWTQLSHIAGRFFTIRVTKEAP